METTTHNAQIKIPAHVAIIMDGNGRWAKARGLNRNAGHQKGVRLLSADKLAELTEERLVFSIPVQIVKDVAQMPV